MEKKLTKELYNIIKSYKEDTVDIIDGLSYSQYDTIKTIEFYYNSKYLTGQKDKRGRDKPFYNVTKAKVKVATRAIDLDTKDIRISSDQPHNPYHAIVASHELYQWFKDTNFAKTLNEAQEKYVKYGGVLFKTVKEGNEVKLETVDWTNVITDQIDIQNGVIIETHFLNAVQLAKKLPNWNMGVSFNECLEAIEKDKGKKPGTLSSTETFTVLEVHGVMPNSYISDAEEADDIFSQQVHFVLGAEKEKNRIVLHSAYEKESPYDFIPYNEVPGRGLGTGVVEDGIESQVWQNDAVLKQRDITENASKIIYKSNNPSIGGNINAYSENGDVIDTSEGDIALMNMTPSSVPIFNDLLEQWNTQYERVSSTFAANTGETLPSGTPFRQTLILNQEANSEFDYRREQFGIALADILNRRVLPVLMKRVNKKHILSSTYSPSEVKAINKGLALKKANKIFTDKILNTSIEGIKKGEVVTQADYDSYVKDISSLVLTKPFLEMEDGDFDDFEGKISIITTGEQRNKGVQLESLFTILQTVAKIPQILQDPVLQQIFIRLVEVADVGISAEALLEDIQQAQPAQQPQGELPQFPQEQQLAQAVA